MSTRQQIFDQVHRNCGELLLTNSSGQFEMIGKQAAGQLLRNISRHAAGQGDSGSIQIQQKDIEQAGLVTAHWDKAAEGGLLRKHGEGASTTYELPNTIKSDGHEVPNTLVALLEHISGKVKAAPSRPGRKR